VNELEALHLGVALQDRWVVRDVSLRFKPGELTAIIGPNGAGKSSLLRALAGVQRANAGQVTLGGTDLRLIARRELARRLSYVPQSNHFPFAFSVREVVATGRNPHLGRFQREQAEDREGIEEALALTDIKHLANRPVTELSGGERQRVMIARSLATRSRVVLLDEPTANLDPAHTVDVLELCRFMAEQGKVVVLAIQDLPLAIRYAPRVALISAGSVAGFGTWDEVMTDAAARSVFGILTRRAYTKNGECTLLFDRANTSASERCRNGNSRTSGY
jgi:iron complex transport system ATP-binding protein